MRKIIIYSYFLLLYCQGCSQDDNFPKDPIRLSAPNKMYARDSFFLAYTVYKFHSSNVVGFGCAERVDIDTIVYSPDTLKLFAFVIDSFEDITRKEISSKYDGHAVLGYRLKTKAPWIVYPVQFTIFVGYSNYNMVRDRLRKAYFQNFAGPMRGIRNYRTKQFETGISYNVIDPRFWDSSFMWQKGVSIPGYYDFQLSGNGDPEMPHPIIQIPQIHYPDSLLKLYYEDRW